MVNRWDGPRVVSCMFWTSPATTNWWLLHFAGPRNTVKTRSATGPDGHERGPRRPTVGRPPHASSVANWATLPVIVGAGSNLRSFHRPFHHLLHRTWIDIILGQGLFEFNRLPMGLNATPATFQRLMELVCSFVENPFLWDKKSPVNSSVVSLKISIAKKRINVTSAIIKVTNQRIVGQEISLPVLTTNDTVQGKAFVNANSGMVIILDFLPTSDILNEVELLLRFEKQPEFEPLLYDFSFVVNSSTSGNDKLHQSLNTGGFGFKNKMVNSVQALPRFFIPSNATQVGVYHIAALYTGSDKKLVINKKVKINAWTIACKSRDISVNEWKYTSAQVHPNSTRDMTVCVVGGDQSAGDINFGQQNVFIAAEFLTPNLIDFTSVFTKFDLETNGAVFATVTVIVLLYIIVMLWARNQDIQDQDKNKVFYLSDLDGDNKCWLLLRVKTVSEEDSGTQSCAYFNLYFHESELGTRELAHPDLKEFETGITYNFIFSMPENYGTPSHIKLWLKGNNACDSWNISELSVFDQENEHV
ncbi:uncharacterized protein LOC144723910 [Lampetra planeri]